MTLQLADTRLHQLQILSPVVPRPSPHNHGDAPAITARDNTTAPGVEGGNAHSLEPERPTFGPIHDREDPFGRSYRRHYPRADNAACAPPPTWGPQPAVLRDQMSIDASWCLVLRPSDLLLFPQPGNRFLLRHQQRPSPKSTIAQRDQTSDHRHQREQRIDYEPHRKRSSQGCRLRPCGEAAIALPRSWCRCAPGTPSPRIRPTESRRPATPAVTTNSQQPPASPPTPHRPPKRLPADPQYCRDSS